MPSNVIIIHPDLGIGGAERLIIDVALALQNRGHQVTIYTSHRDESHCFEEARDGTLDVRVRGNTVFPALLFGRFHLLMAMLRQLHLTISVLTEMGRTDKKRNSSRDGLDFQDDIFIIDQLPACVPILKLFGERFASHGIQNNNHNRYKQRILFYCHFPDQLLARRNEANSVLRLFKNAYRYPLDWFEGCAISASDKVVANSNFTRGVVKHVFGETHRLGDVSIVYPCVDTKEGPVRISKPVIEQGSLWGGKKIVLSINRFERKKGTDLAIRAYHGLSVEARKGTRLVIAGGYDNRVLENVQYHRELDDLALGFGLQTATSKTVISALSIPDSIDVLFLLSVPSAFRDTLLHNSKLLLYTPVNEHFGIVPVEAMHAGLPVLASNTGGPLESIVEGETGWLRDTKHINEWTAIMEKVLLEMTEQDFENMARNGVERVESEFSLHALEDKLEGEIRGMLGAERRPFAAAAELWKMFFAFLFSGIALAFFLRYLVLDKSTLARLNCCKKRQQGKMPVVIDLIDSSSPPPSTQPRPLGVRRSPATRPPSSPNFLSDNFDSSVFVYDDPGQKQQQNERFAKTRRITPELDDKFQLPNDSSLFTFSDDIHVNSPALPPLPPPLQSSVSRNNDRSAQKDIPTGKTCHWDGYESDPVVFTSSAPERTTATERQKSRIAKNKTTATITIDDDGIEEFSDPFVWRDEGSDKILDDPRQKQQWRRQPALKRGYSDRTASLLASLSDNIGKAGSTSSEKPRIGSRGLKRRDNFDLDLVSDILEEPEKATKPKRKPKLNLNEKEARAKERAAAKARLEREKEAEKERKRLQKEEKAKEKQLAADIAEVNKLKTHKKETVAEIIVDMSTTFEETGVGNQVAEYMKHLGVDYTFFQSTIPNVVKWRRKKNANYNEEAGFWEPCPVYVASENYVLSTLSAQEFVDMLVDPSSGDATEDSETLEHHVLKLKSAYSNCKLIYLINGLSAWIRKNQNSRNRAFQAEVLRQVNDADMLGDAHQNNKDHGNKRRRKKTKKPEDSPPVDDDIIEDALLQLQVTHNCIIYHTTTSTETAEWIKNFSEHISTVPYRHAQMAQHDGAAFCMETGQVKTGEDKLDTFVKMLQEINRVTAPMAYGIIAKYPSVVDLLKGMKHHGPTLLEDVRKSANKNGALTDSRIGPAASKRLYKVFMGLDEESADI
ncbi:hypothetical protein BGW36DRAFT_297637 [Talaromyces proteolyticus]|uniref:Asparagine-linked glycosylation protein 2 n=1 Tax=Talaromyces proteolyticus TaxID=1131652 RepID=A0AAD4PXF8_9EURO|nr:uncharacterized protein BGW36DRAFT_297637 [Talaromyces proteolyticus]KAH8696349.1 hypothetical protein BGW36DRAFT_297637 [Talaromyces proteolyticus]